MTVSGTVWGLFRALFGTVGGLSADCRRDCQKTVGGTVAGLSDSPLPLDNMPVWTPPGLTVGRPPTHTDKRPVWGSAGRVC